MAWLPDSQPEQMRASDGERDVVLARLGDDFAQGRLSHDTFVFRVEATLRARLRGELDRPGIHQRDPAQRLADHRAGARPPR